MDRTEFDDRGVIDTQSSAVVDGPAIDSPSPKGEMPAHTSNGDRFQSDTRSSPVAAEPAVHGASPDRSVPAPTSFDGQCTRDIRPAVSAVDLGPAIVALPPIRSLPARTNTETVGRNGNANHTRLADEGRAGRPSTPEDRALPAPKKRAARKAARNIQAPLGAVQPKRGSRKQATDDAATGRTSPKDRARGAVGGPAKKARGRKAIDLTAPTGDVLPEVAGLTNQGGDTAEGHTLPTVVEAPDPALSPIILEIREQHRQRQDLMRAETSLTLQIRAKCRRLCGGDKDEAGVVYKAMSGKGEHPLADLALAANRPFLDCRDVLTETKKTVEKRLDVLAKQLPVAAWVEGIKGIGIASLAALIGETGDLSTYANPAKVWKRMGLAVIDGGRQRRIAGDAAIEHGFSPTRRAIMWNIGASMLRANGTYRPVYDARKAYELERGIPPGQAHARAKRYMEKRILLHVWRAWNGMTVPAVEPYVATVTEDAA